MKYLFLLFHILTSLNYAFSQINSIVELHKINGYGPQGTTFHSLSEREKSEFAALYPVAINIPETWKDIKVYYYVLNEKQLLFQSYVQGIFDKNTLAELFKKRKYSLTDTLNLSRTSLFCGISFAVGKDKESEDYYYIIDSDHNNDFGDNVIKNLASQNNLFGVETLGEQINFQYFHEGKIFEEAILLSLSVSDDNYVYVSIPQYYLANLSLNGKSYFMCKNLGSTAVYVIPALPYFNPIKADKRLLKGQYFTMDDLQFSIKNIILDGKYVEIDGPVALKGAAICTEGAGANDKVSAQTGYKAPQISGVNVLDGTEWSLDRIKDERYLYLYFWSTTCAPCIQDLKNLTSIADKYKDKVQFVGICDVRSDLNKILLNNQVTWPNLILQQSSIKSTDYNIYKYPTSFLLNKDHIVEKLDLRSAELRAFLESTLSSQ